MPPGYKKRIHGAVFTVYGIFIDLIVASTTESTSEETVILPPLAASPSAPKPKLRPKFPHGEEIYAARPVIVDIGPLRRFR